jgi:hypothetical protein
VTKKELVQKEREPIYDSAIPQLPPFPLVGRAEVLEAIKQWIWTANDELNDGGGTGALYRMPGVGKTALAHDPEVRADFLDGVLWAGLGLAPEPTTILSRWGTLLDVSPTVQAKQKSDEWRRLLQEAIGERAFLIVLDDAWRIEDARNLQIGGPYCAYLITTRSSEVAATLAGEGGL